MAHLVSGQTGTRARPKSLSSGSDLQADQESFLRANLEPESANAAIAALSFGRSAKSPSASVLQPIEERAVRRRRRRSTAPKPTGVSFPPVESAAPFGKSRFSRGQQNNSLSVDGSQTAASTAGGALNDGIDALQVEDMTPEQILEAQQEISSLLSPGNVEFLRERGRARLQTPRSVNTVDSDTAKKDGFSRNVTQERKGQQNPISGSEARSSCSTEEGIRRTGEKADKEFEGQLWMTDANVEVESQQELDQMFTESASVLGSLGNRRFNLSGKLLSMAEEASLPMHLGLHHHGVSPSRAGYTLSEIMVLARSTVTSQRILSLRMLADVLRLHFDEVIHTLKTSGGLEFVFGAFPAHIAKELGASGQQAYVEAVGAIVCRYINISLNELVPAPYFGSRLYSSDVPDLVYPVLESLATSGCIPLLVQISISTSAYKDRRTALRSLAMVRALCLSSDSACQAMFQDLKTLESIKQLAVGTDALQPWTTLLAADIISMIIPHIAIQGSDAVQRLKANLLNESYLQRISAHLSWFMTHDGNTYGVERKEAAMGVMRLLRAALAYELGVISVTAIASAICRLTQEALDISTEAYLTLEAYVHALYTSAVSSSTRNGRIDTGDGLSESARREHGYDSFVKDQLSELVPVALAAATVFASSSQPEAISKRSAAGHFAATLLSLSTIPVDKGVVIKVFDQCSAATKAARSHQVDDNRSLHGLQALASLTHAGARLLSKVKLEPLYARREVDCLFEGAVAEYGFLTTNRPIYAFSWRCTANACAEWVATLTRADISNDSASRAIRLLPYLLDPQVVLDLLSRCLLRVEVVRNMNKEVTIDQARKAAEDLLSISLPELSTACAAFVRHEEVAVIENSRTCQSPAGPFSICEIIALWVNHKDVIDSALLVALSYLRAGLISAQELFWKLLSACTSQQAITDRLVEGLYLSAVAAGEDGHTLGLPMSETTVSTTSTKPNPAVVESVLCLADFLVERGPSADLCHDGKDPCACIILFFMCRRSVHGSLRQALWRRTVTDCGGGVLFRNATNIAVKWLSDDSCTSVGHDDFIMAVEYVDALTHGLLARERCPTVLGEAILAEFNEIIVTRDGEKIMEPLRRAILGNNTNCSDSIHTILQTARENVNSTSVFATWAQSVYTLVGL